MSMLLVLDHTLCSKRLRIWAHTYLFSNWRFQASGANKNALQKIPWIIWMKRCFCNWYLPEKTGVHGLNLEGLLYQLYLRSKQLNCGLTESGHCFIRKQLLIYLGFLLCSILWVRTYLFSILIFCLVNIGLFFWILVLEYLPLIISSLYCCYVIIAFDHQMGVSIWLICFHWPEMLSLNLRSWNWFLSSLVHSTKIRQFLLWRHATSIGLGWSIWFKIFESFVLNHIV